MFIISGIRENINEIARKTFSPGPQDQKEQGFVPNFYISFLRKISRLLIFLLGLNGRNRFSNEFMQTLDPKITINLPNREKIVFRTGHGRLLWRAKALFTEEPMIIDWIDGFNSSDCFYDVGANIGNYSLYAAKKGIRTFAFEPEFNNLSLLYENIFLNNLQEKCTPIPVALGDSTNMDTFYLKSISKGDALHSIGRKSYLIKNPASVDYRLNAMVMKLDDLIQTFNLPKPSRLKIDVDYNELKIVKGALATLDHVNEVYIEIDPALAEHRETLQILESKSFHIVRKEKIPRPWNEELSNCILRKKGFE